MSRQVRFRHILPTLETAIAALFGGMGLWERNQILSQCWLFGTTLRDTTAAFHVWPWPFKFAAISNTPAFIIGGFVSYPVADLWPNLPEVALYAPSLLMVAVIWYWVGYRFDRIWCGVGTDGMTGGSRTPWILLIAFTAVSLAGAFLPLGHVGWLPYGVLLWLIAAAIIRRRTRTPRSAIAVSKETK